MTDRCKFPSAYLGQRASSHSRGQGGAAGERQAQRMDSQPGPSLPSTASQQEGTRSCGNREIRGLVWAPGDGSPVLCMGQEGVLVLAAPGPAHQAALWGSSKTLGLARSSQKRDSHGGIGAAPCLACKASGPPASRLLPASRAKS